MARRTSGRRRTRPTQRRASRTLGPSTRTRSSGHLSGLGTVKKWMGNLSRALQWWRVLSWSPDPKVVQVEKAVFAQEANESASSSQTSTGKVPWDNPFIRGLNIVGKVLWDNPFIRGLNIVKEQPPLKRPARGRVPGAGGGRQHVDYGRMCPPPRTYCRQRRIGSTRLYCRRWQTWKQPLTSASKPRSMPR